LQLFSKQHNFSSSIAETWGKRGFIDSHVPRSYFLQIFLKSWQCCDSIRGSRRRSRSL